MTQLSTWGTPLPPRAPGELISSLSYLRVPTNPDTTSTSFRHRDGRIWAVRVAPVTDQRLTSALGLRWVAQITSSGCRAVSFVAGTRDAVQKSVLRFANLVPEIYDRVIADAVGTHDFPRPGRLGVVRMEIAEDRPLSVQHIRQRREASTAYETVTGLGRIDGATIILFPTVAELTDLLDRCLTDGTQVLIDRNVNVPGHDPHFSNQVAERARFDLATRQLANEPDEMEAHRTAAQAHLGTEDLFDRIQSGELILPAPRERNDRAIDLD